MKNMLESDKIIILIIGGLSLFALVFIIIFAVNEQKNADVLASIVTYTKESQEKPKVQVDSNFMDLGKISLKDEKRASFEILNTGNKPLQLFKITSSCSCTVGQVTINGVNSPEMGMHAANPWVGTLEPGVKATVSVIYRPYIMPLAGEVTREVYIQTNDPDNNKLIFTVKAFVE